MRLFFKVLSLTIFILPISSYSQDLLVKFKDPSLAERAAEFFQFNDHQVQIENLNFRGWIKVSSSENLPLTKLEHELMSQSEVAYVQPDYELQLLADFRLKDVQQREKLKAFVESNPELLRSDDRRNPSFPEFPFIDNDSGDDPNLANQWGLSDIGVELAWNTSTGSEDIVVAVIDTGVDYTHEDLVSNIWVNQGEQGLDENGNAKATNKIDDDLNGYVDDVVGWDFADNDNKPFDVYMSSWRVLIGGGNPGHGTHCAGTIAARGKNAKGISGIAPNVRIMPVRFLSENGSGATSAAVGAITYAVKNGAQILSNSWGQIGEVADATENLALKEAIEYSLTENRLFIAAAGNGNQFGQGYSNDDRSSAAYPATYAYDNIISVAAINRSGRLGGFSNYGKETVHIAAPGLSVYSTVPNHRYTDKVVSFLGMGVAWDGTSMAAPHVAGAAAWYWSKNPELTAIEVKNHLLNAAEPVNGLEDKLITGGKLSLKGL